MNESLASGVEETTVEIKNKFVRVREVRPDGLVCFEFAIGWPELFVDLMLPQPAFDEFCVQNQVQLLKI
jgi:phenol hydroxylase P0 protein